MNLSDLSIRRPVFATVMSLLLITLGVMAFARLTLRELPAIDPPVVSVDVSYPGASASVVETVDLARPVSREICAALKAPRSESMRTMRLVGVPAAGSCSSDLNSILFTAALPSAR